jgi:hypothetical protein
MQWCKNNVPSKAIMPWLLMRFSKEYHLKRKHKKTMNKKENQNSSLATKQLNRS